MEVPARVLAASVSLYLVFDTSVEVVRLYLAPSVAEASLALVTKLLVALLVMSVIGLALWTSNIVDPKPLLLLFLTVSKLLLRALSASWISTPPLVESTLISGVEPPVDLL